MSCHSAGVPTTQIGFFDVFVLPLMTSFVKVFPECQPILDQATNNYKRWQAKANSRSGKEALAAKKRKEEV
jgi:hypothetical protein